MAGSETQKETVWCPFGESAFQHMRFKLISSIKKRHVRTFPEPKRGRRGAHALARSVKEWESAIGTLNPEVAIKITSKVVQAIMARW